MTAKSMNALLRDLDAQHATLRVSIEESRRHRRNARYLKAVRRGEADVFASGTWAGELM